MQTCHLRCCTLTTPYWCIRQKIFGWLHSVRRACRKRVRLNWEFWQSRSFTGQMITGYEKCRWQRNCIQRDTEIFGLFIGCGRASLAGIEATIGSHSKWFCTNGQDMESRFRFHQDEIRCVPAMYSRQVAVWLRRCLTDQNGKTESLDKKGTSILSQSTWISVRSKYYK